LGVIVLLIALFYFITGTISKYTGFSVSGSKDDDFRVCLEEKDITLYINSENPAKTLRKIELIDYLRDIKIFNCLRNNQVCLDKGVGAFPTWIINKNKIEKDISISELSGLSGCRLIK